MPEEVMVHHAFHTLGLLDKGRWLWRNRDVPRCRTTAEAAAYLRRLGLVVRDSPPNPHHGHDGEVVIGKPTGLPGREIPGLACFWMDEQCREIPLACWLVTIHLHHGRWLLNYSGFKAPGGRGPQFDREFSTLREAVIVGLEWFGMRP
jgi:hypothetical protein